MYKAIRVATSAVPVPRLTIRLNKTNNSAQAALASGMTRAMRQSSILPTTKTRLPAMDNP
jgi:hypothetical protein